MDSRNFTLIYLTLALIFHQASCPAAELSAGKKPNFIVVLVDDLGWSDLGCYGTKYYETPNIDALASDGIRFTDAYAAASICSPTRAALLTGRYPARLGITDWIVSKFQEDATQASGKKPGEFESVDKKLSTPRNQTWMKLDEVTLAEALEPAGYVSCHIGKWHLGGKAHHPEKQGFDFNIGGCDYGQPPTYFYPYQNQWQAAMPELEEGETGEYLTDRESFEAVRFIKQHREKPFFLYLAHYAVHAPIEAKPKLVEKYEVKPKNGQKHAAYAAMIESVDDSVGNILKTLDELEIADNTIVIFTSDNGGYSRFTNNDPLKAGKGTPYEGGIRVPLIIRWSGITADSHVSTVPVSSVDLFPTVLEIAGVDPPKKRLLDGESLVRLLEGSGGLEGDALYWHFPHYRGNDATPYGIVRTDGYKLIRYYENAHAELYNLDEDIGETTDLARDMPEKVKQLDVMLSKWLISVGAKMPKLNPDYNAGKPAK